MGTKTCFFLPGHEEISVFLCLPFPPQNTVPQSGRGRAVLATGAADSQHHVRLPARDWAFIPPQAVGAPGGVCRGLGVSQGFHEAVAAFELLRKDPIWWRHGEGLVPASMWRDTLSAPQRDMHSRNPHCPSSGVRGGGNGQKHRLVSSGTCCSRPVIRCSIIQRPFSISSIPLLYPDPTSRKYTPKWQKPKFLQLPTSKLPTK